MAMAIAASLTGCSEKETETMHPNEELARDAYEAFRNKDIPAVMELLTDDISLVVPGKSIQSGTFKAKAKSGVTSRLLANTRPGRTRWRSSTCSQTTRR